MTPRELSRLGTRPGWRGQSPHCGSPHRAEIARAAIRWRPTPGWRRIGGVRVEADAFLKTVALLESLAKAKGIPVPAANARVVSPDELCVHNFEAPFKALEWIVTHCRPPLVGHKSGVSQIGD